MKTENYSPLEPTPIDSLPVYVRAYVASSSGHKDPRKPPNPQQGPSEYTLVIDAETAIDTGQQLHFGVWQLRRHDELVEIGIFYNPKGLQKPVQACIFRYCKKHRIKVLTAAAFVDEVLFGQAYDLRANICGLNLPYDISRLAVRYGSARGKTMRGGFTFQLSDDKYKPRVQIRHLSSRAALKQFTKPRKQFQSRGMRNRGLLSKPRRGSFVDLRTIAAALTSLSFNLASLGDFLKTPHRKQHTEEHGGPVTETYIEYALNDVQVTWECFVALRNKFEEHGLRKTLLSQLMSEAGLGKAYLREMGIGSLGEIQPDFPDAHKGIIMSSYYGGRSEVHIRRQTVQVLYCDFLSMYPTACTLEVLWRFVVAKKLKWKDSTPEIVAFLDTVTLNDLQCPSTWAGLASIVQVVPDGDRLPVRAKYDGESQAKIGLNCLSSNEGMYFTLADCIASKLRTGKCPKVIRAITFTPEGVQDDLEPIAILGNRKFRINPSVDDFYKRLIELRTEIKQRLKTAKGQEAIELEAAQQFLKILANSTSYGIFVELNVAELDGPETRLCHGPSGKSFPISTTKVEEPGRYFHPLLASLITGAARLMLAISETLAIRAGLDWAFCDTDSMALAKPDAMSEQAFYRAAQSVRDWFTPLNPYIYKEPLFKIEDANYGLRRGGLSDKLMPLFCLAISDKRYVLFNIGRDGKPIIRKASAHGLGHLLPPYREKDAPASIPKPALPLHKIGVERWQYDLWYQTIIAALEGHLDTVDLGYHPALNNPAASRYGATTPALLNWFKKYNETVPAKHQIRPFNFMLAYQVSPHRFAMRQCRGLQGTDKFGRAGLRVPRPVSPYDSDITRAAKNCFDRETGERVSEDLLMTYREALAQFQLHPESKFLNGNPYDQGLTTTRTIQAVAINLIGKEANRWEEQHFLGASEEAQIEYGMTPRSSRQLQHELKRVVAGTEKISQRDLAKEARISRSTLSKLFRGKPVRNAEQIMRRVLHAVRQIGREKDYEQREQARLSKMRPKEQWLDKIGGFRIGETPDELRGRIAEIGQLEKLLRSGQVGPEGAELILHHLRELKGMYFEDHNPEDD